MARSQPKEFNQGVMPMRAVITVVGKDMVGILAQVSRVCSDSQVNIVEVTQSVLHEFFAMVMLVDLSGSPVSCASLAEKMDALGKRTGLSIHVMHEDVFNSMHRV